MSEPIPVWLEIAESLIGIKEIAGSEHHPMIVEFLKTATRGKILPDETPWCSAFLNYVLIRAGFRPTYSLAAKDWLNWGRKLDSPRKGCIAVLDRDNPNAEDWQGHVGLYLRTDYADNRVLLLGGNQDNRVYNKWYDMDLVVGWRWPNTQLFLKAVERIATFKKLDYLRSTLPEPTPTEIDTGVAFYHTPRWKGWWSRVWAVIKSAGYATAGALQVYAGQGTLALGKGLEGLLDVVDKDTVAELEVKQETSFTKAVSELIACIIQFFKRIFHLKETTS